MTSPWSSEDITLNGVSLKTYGWSLRNNSGLDTMPARKGANQPIAFGHGTRHYGKQFDEVVRPVTLWFDGADPDTGIAPASGAQRKGQLNANIRELMGVLASDYQIAVVRQVLQPNGSTEEWTATCSVSDSFGIEFDDDSNDQAGVGVDLLFADPFWYGPSQSASVGLSGTLAVDNPGEVIARKMVLTFNGPLTNARLTNTTMDVWVQIAGSISGGDSIVVDTGAASVVRTSDGANLIGALTQSGAREFMRLARGSNTLDLSATAGSGNCGVVFSPPRL
jgi:hypothetical protein